MEDNFKKQGKAKQLPDLNDDEFCVSITKAAELSRLSESQIRYLEVLPGINIGKRRPGERNRVYTRQDVNLLRWIVQQDVRPSEIADILKQNQEQILKDLGHVTLDRVIQREDSSSGEDVLISRLVTLLISIWQEVAQSAGAKGDAIILSVIFGPQNESWKSSFIKNCEEEHSIDLANSLVTWSMFPKEDLAMDLNVIFGNLQIVFARQSCYLPYMDEVIYDTSRFSSTTDPFAVAILWLPVKGKTSAHRKLQASAQYINKSRSKKRLVDMLMRSLRNTLRRSPQPTNIPISVYSRGVMGRYAVKRGLELLLNMCIRPYFPDCYCYVAKFGTDNQLEILSQCGDAASGYLPKVMAAHQIPWWISFARERASLALAQDSHASSFRKRSEYGSTVCFPLIILEKVVGVLSIESVDKAKHSLAEHDGLTSADLLRYLICISEIAAEYLNLMESSAQKAERSKLAYTGDETLSWWLDVYRSGGADYTKVVEKTYEWIKQAQISPEDAVELVLVDIYKEGDLAARYQGFEVVIDIVRRTRERINELIQSDPILTELVANNHLYFCEEPVGEHLFLGTVHVPRNYLLIFLEQIRAFWQEQGDTFVWKENEIEVVLQVGVCRFSGLGGYDKKVASRMMNYHLKRLAQQLYDRHKDRPLNHVLEQDAVVVTEKVGE